MDAAALRSLAIASEKSAHPRLMPSAKTIDAHEFYREYHGHTIPHLERLHESLRGVYPAARRLWTVL